MKSTDFCFLPCTMVVASASEFSMGFNLYFDYAAIVILVFLLIAIILKKQFFGIGNKLYFFILVCALISAILDVLASISTFPISLLFALNTLFMASRASTALSIFLYACSLGKIFYKMIRKKWSFFLILIPILIFTILLIVNCFTRFVFDYVEGPKYVRGPFRWTAYAVSYLYVLTAVVIVLSSRKYHSRAQIAAVVGVFLVQVGVSVFQLLVPMELVEMLVVAITLLTLSLFIESPEHFIDQKLMQPSYRSFLGNTTRQFDLKEPFSVIFVVVENAATLYNLCPHEQAIGFLRLCCASISEKVHKIDSSATTYSIGNSTLAFIYSERSKDEEMLDLVRHEFSVPAEHNGIRFQFESKTCLVNCPEDCNDVSDLIAFSSTYPKLTDKHFLDVTPYRHERGNILFNLDHILQRAIENKSFSVYYQGIYSIKEKDFVAAEGLLRLNDPDFGTIMPSLMIPYAETSGKIGEIGRIVMEKSFEFFATKLRGRLSYIEVNLSPIELLNPNLSSDIKILAEKYEIKPDEIVFEITEEAVLMADVSTEANIDAIRKMGYRIAIDDFGTGYSNLSRILQLDISILKFDRTMTKILAQNQQDDFFLGLFTIFHNRNVTVLFEGVEDKEVAEKLEKMGADHIQGYYYSKTIPEEDFLRLIGK